MLTYYPSCPEETSLLARSFAKTLRRGAVLCFFGDLGAGKTTFIKALVNELGVPSELVISPTFQYLNIYQGKIGHEKHCDENCAVFHFDLYRLRNHEEFVHSGFHEFLSQDGIACIEWAERIEAILPENIIQIRISHIQEEGSTIETRKVEISI